DDLQHQRRRGHEAESHIEADPSAGFVSLFQLMHAICHGYYTERPQFGANASIRQRYGEARGARELTTAEDSRFPVRYSRGQDCVTNAIRSIDTARVHVAHRRRGSRVALAARAAGRSRAAHWRA